MLTTGQDTQQMINSAQAQDRFNKTWSAAQADKQMAFQQQSNATAMAFSADQAEKNRQFQQYNSDTAHQREVKDLVKAGLNPVLSAKYGGSSTPSGNSAQGVSSQGSKGDTDGSMVGLFSNLISAVTNQATALTTTAMNNQTNITTTQIQAQVAEIVSKINASAIISTANINARTQLSIQAQSQAFEEYMKATYPQTVPGAVSSLSESFTTWLKENGNGKSFGENIAEWLKQRKENGIWLNKNKDGTW